MEFLALKWDVVVKTDNNPFTHLLSTAKLDVTGHRWLAALSEFWFSLKYRPGVGNQDGDTLSRRPYATNIGQKSLIHLPLEGVLAVCQRIEHWHKGATGAKAMGVTPARVQRYYCDLTQVRRQELPQLTRENMRRDQHEDPLGSLIKKSLSVQVPQMLLSSYIEGAKVVHKEIAGCRKL